MTAASFVIDSSTSTSSSSSWHQLDQPIVCVRDDSLTTTGNQVWNAAKVLFRALERESTAQSCFALRAGDRVLELGAGIGWLALTLAASVDSLRVVATDQAAQLPLLQHNVDLFQAPVAARTSRVDVVPLDFFADAAAVSDLRCSVAQWSLVIASDVVYSLPLARAFASTVARILHADVGETKRQPCCMLYCHTVRRYDDVDRELLRSLRQCGVAVSELADVGVERAVTSIADDEEIDIDAFELFGEQKSIVMILRSATSRAI